MLVGVLLSPVYVFYALLCGYVAGQIWVVCCIAIYVYALMRWRRASVAKLLLASSLLSLAISMTSIPVFPGLFTVLLFTFGCLVLSLLSFGIYRLS